jgi:hypothetical protein
LGALLDSAQARETTTTEDGADIPIVGAAWEHFWGAGRREPLVVDGAAAALAVTEAIAASGGVANNPANCVVCQDELRCMGLDPCCHVPMCEACHSQVASPDGRGNCPLCRVDFVGAQKLILVPDKPLCIVCDHVPPRMRLDACGHFAHCEDCHAAISNEDGGGECPECEVAYVSGKIFFL